MDAGREAAAATVTDGKRVRKVTTTSGLGAGQSWEKMTVISWNMEGREKEGRDRRKSEAKPVDY